MPTMLNLFVLQKELPRSPLPRKMAVELRQLERGLPPITSIPEIGGQVAH